MGSLRRDFGVVNSLWNASLKNLIKPGTSFARLLRKRLVMFTAPVGSLERLLETLDLRRPAVAAHSRRVAAYARLLGIGMGSARRS